MHIMMRFGGFMIHAGLFLVEGLLIATAVLCAELSRWYLSFFFFVCGALALLFHFLARNRIAFAAATLHVGCEIVLHYPMLQLVAFIGALASVGFFFIFALAIYGFYNYKKSKDASNKEIVLPILVFIFVFFWTQQVFRYITIATTVRVVLRYSSKFHLVPAPSGRHIVLVVVRPASDANDAPRP